MLTIASGVLPLRVPIGAGLAVSLALAGCGGGGGGGGNSLDDPLFRDQWHLENRGQFDSAATGEDINVVAAWDQGASGRDVKVAVVDTGVEIDHEELRGRTDLGLNWDFVSGGDGDPTPPRLDGLEHGTAVAALIGAESDNLLGGKGVAHGADLVGVRLLSGGAIPVSDMVDAMLLHGDVIAVSNNSWGHAPDETGEVVDPIPEWQTAVATGAQQGRGGKGIVYVWAAGNGGEDFLGNALDNSNYDFQANNRHVIAVGALDARGVKTFYSEKGANLLVSAPGGTPELGITTADFMGRNGANDGTSDVDYADSAYTKHFLGTSAATPVVAGVVALMLEANPDLSWRDVRMILAESARRNDPTDSDWASTVPAAGQPVYHVNHKYGFGAVDAQAAVALARGWVPVVAPRAEASYSSGPLNVPIEDFSATGVTSSVTVDLPVVIEHVAVEVSIIHEDIGDLEIVLRSPWGTESVLAEPHRCVGGDGKCDSAFNPWTFGSVRHLGEEAAGPWQLTVADRVNGNVGDFIRWELTVYGR